MNFWSLSPAHFKTHQFISLTEAAAERDGHESDKITRTAGENEERRVAPRKTGRNVRTKKED